MNYTWESADQAHINLKRLLSYVITYRKPSTRETNPTLFQELLNDFDVAIENDLNTAVALAVTWNTINSSLSSQEKLELLYKFDEVFGFGFKDLPDNYFDQIIPESVLKLANDREDARKSKDFQKSDELRSQIENAGYLIEDTPEGYALKKN